MCQFNCFLCLFAKFEGFWTPFALPMGSRCGADQFLILEASVQMLLFFPPHVLVHLYDNSRMRLDHVESTVVVHSKMPFHSFHLL